MESASISSISSEITCPHCEVTFCAKKNMYRHIRKFHPEKEVDMVCNQICTLCNSKFRTLNELLIHMDSSHSDVKLCYENKVFCSKTDFERWKEEMERDTQSSFFITSGKMTLKDGVVTYYRCHRSGQCKIKKKRKRRLKFGGSIKSGITCPAYMKVLERTVDGASEIRVEWQSVHAGHKKGVGKLPLSETDENDLASLLEHVVPTSNYSNLSIDISDSKEGRAEEQDIIVQQTKKNKLLDLNSKKEAWTAEFQFLISQIKSEEEMMIMDETLKTLKARFVAADKKLPTLPVSVGCLNEPANKFILPPKDNMVILKREPC